MAGSRPGPGAQKALRQGSYPRKRCPETLSILNLASSAEIGGTDRVVRDRKESLCLVRSRGCISADQSRNGGQALWCLRRPVPQGRHLMLGPEGLGAVRLGKLPDETTADEQG